MRRPTRKRSKNGVLTLHKSRYDGPPTSHFDGVRFHNDVPVEPRTFSEVVRWQINRRELPRWPGRGTATPGPRPPHRVDAGRLRITFVNHATTLIQIDGQNFLTDPIWSKRPSPFRFAGPPRHEVPGIRFEDLPPIDGVLVSHNHYDHLDVPTLRRLAGEHEPEILLGLGNTALLERYGIPGGRDLDWWQHTEVGDARITFVPARHWSARGLADRFRTLWGGFIVESDSGVVYFAGDTGYGPHFEEIRDRFPRIRLALLPIGAYKPRWFMQDQHMSPAEAFRAHQELDAAHSLAIHFGTFPLADDGPDEAVAELRELIARADGPLAPFWVPDHGEGRDVPSVPALSL